MSDDVLVSSMMEIQYTGINPTILVSNHILGEVASFLNILVHAIQEIEAICS